MRARTSIRGIVPSLCVLAGVLMFTVAPAQALVVHRFERSFGSAGTGSGQLSEPDGIAVNDTTHDVYVVDSGNGRVEEFGPEGAFVGEFDGTGAPTGTFSFKGGSLGYDAQIAVDNSGDPLDPSNEDVYVVEPVHAVIDKFTASGMYLGQLTGVPAGAFEPNDQKGSGNRQIKGVAVDPSGTVWVSTGPLGGQIYSFSDALVNQYVSELTPETGGGEVLAVDSEDNLYVGSGGSFVKVSSSGETLSNPFGGDVKGPLAVAVDPVGHEVYLDNQGHASESFESIEAFALNGAPIESSESGAPAPSFGAGDLTFSRGVAVDASNATVYATDHTGDRVAIFEAITLPSVSVAALSEPSPRAVMLNGSVDPEGKPVSSCVFEYVVSSEYEAGASNPYAKGATVACDPSQPGGPGGGTAEVPVKAEVKGLTPEASYDYRLVAGNTGGKSSTSDQQFVAGPILGAESVLDVASGSATLQASVDPNGDDTHYYFQYGSTAAYGSYVPVSPPGVDIGSLGGEQTVSVHLQALEPGVTYHYRFVAVQGGETFAEGDRSFTTQGVGVGSGASASLLDGRAWELVSPANKKGALIEPFEELNQIQAAADGSGITYLAAGPSISEGPVGKVVHGQVLSRRGPAGWSTEDLTLPNRLPEGERAEELSKGSNEYKLFSPDLSLAAVEPQRFGTPPLSPEATERTLYLRDDLDGSFAPLVTPADVPPGTKIEESGFGAASTFPDKWQMHFVAATPDLGHIVFETPLALTQEAIDEEGTVQSPIVSKGVELQLNLYEWGAGKLGLVNILPDGEATHGQTDSPVRLAGTNINEGSAVGDASRAVSSDGRRIAWTWGVGNPPLVYRGLFVRDMVEERTVRVGGPNAVFQTMNSDGSMIFFLEGGDLYEFDFDTGEQVDLTPVVSHGPGEAGAGVQEAVSDVSEDGSYVYFVATGALAGGGVSGEDNLYLLHDSEGAWTTIHIATLSHEDSHSWFAKSKTSGTIIGSNEEPYDLHLISSRVSPDGRYLVFMSERPLTGYDNTDAVSGQPDEEVYLYHAPGNPGTEAGSLICASCDPTGARPVGLFDTGQKPLVDRSDAWGSIDESVGGAGAHWLAGSVPGWDETGPAAFTTYQPRYLSDSGRLFFNSPAGLVPQATNGLEDVYEYEPAVGAVGGSQSSPGAPPNDSCTEATATGSSVYVPAAGGCVGLVSSGISSSESVFYDASENGDDVFFLSTAELVPSDHEPSYSLYDAHVCGSEGVPCTAEAVASPPCTTEASCRPAPSPQPEIFGPTPSATFSGAGNIAPAAAQPAVKAKTKPAKCKRGFIRKKGKVRHECVKKAPTKHKPARKEARKKQQR